MTLKNLLYEIAKYASKNKIINYSAAGPSLYQLNMETIKDYPVLFASPTGSHNVSPNLTTYTITLYYIDRLTTGGENDVDILSNSVEGLKTIINGIKRIPGIVEIYDDYSITNFADTQRMSDKVAGAYATIVIRTTNETTCTGEASVDGDYIPDIDDIKLQNKGLSIDENGTYTITADAGYTGLKTVNLNVNVPVGDVCPELEEITITENGTYEGAYNKVNVNVPNTDLTTIDVAEYGIKFTNSPLTEISEIFDFSNVTDYSYMFTNCENLTGSPIGDSIVVDGSGDYAFYGSNIQIPSNIHINTDTSTFNMIGYGSFTTTDESYLDIVCDNFPFNIISRAEYDGFLNITLGERYIPFTDGPYEEEYQLFKDFDGKYIRIKPQPDQELKWLLKGCTAETIILGDNSTSFNCDNNASDGSNVVWVDNCEELILEGDYSNYGWKTTNGRRFYTEYKFYCIKVGGCKNLKGDFDFENADTDINSIRDFINNIGSVPVEDDCRIWLPTNFDGLLTDEEIGIITSKGYSLYFEF